MTQPDTPPWLVQEFERSVLAVHPEADGKEITAAWKRLEEAWRSPGRVHHDIRHLSATLTRVNTVVAETHHPAQVRLACFYHGAVFSTALRVTYTGRGGEDEDASADFAALELAGLGVEPTVVGAITSLIRGLKRKPDDAVALTAPDPADSDQLALSDAHLAVLAADPQAYSRYLEGIVAEYSHVPAEAFRSARKEIVSRLLARRTIFTSPLGRQWESAARQNLTAELERLEALTPHPSPPSPASPEPAATDTSSLRAQSWQVDEPDDDSPVDRSTLEAAPTSLAPGRPISSLNKEELRKLKRETISQEMRARIERRKPGTSGPTGEFVPSGPAVPTADPPTGSTIASPVRRAVPRPQGTSSPAPLQDTAVTPESGQTPEWVDEDAPSTESAEAAGSTAVARCGMEKSPDY